MDQQIVPAHSSRNRLILNRDQFDDYLVTLMARLRTNDAADRLLSGETRHPLVEYQSVYSAALRTLRTIPFTLRQFVSDPVGYYQYFTQTM